MHSGFFYLHTADRYDTDFNLEEPDVPVLMLGTCEDWEDSPFGAGGSSCTTRLTLFALEDCIELMLFLTDEQDGTQYVSHFFREESLPSD